MIKSRSLFSALPSPSDVLAAGTAFNSKNWLIDDYPAIGKFIKESGILDGALITRNSVFKLVQSDPVAAVKLTLVWGYRAGTINGHRPPISNTFLAAEEIAKELEKLRDAPPVSATALLDTLDKISPNGIGPSTTTKWACFFGIEAEEGPCLIYDHRVIKCIVERTFVELDTLADQLPSPLQKNRKSEGDLTKVVASAISRHKKTYGNYLLHLNGLSEEQCRLGNPVSGSQLEMAIFSNSPARAYLAKRTRQSKKQRDLVQTAAKKV